MGYYDVSAKLNINIDECLEDITVRSYRQRDIAQMEKMNYTEMEERSLREEKNEISQKQDCCIF